MSKAVETLARGIAVSLTLCSLISWGEPAFGHGDAQWIADEPKFSYCCGVHDCERAPLNAVLSIKDGWYLPSTGQTFVEGSPDLHVSRDHDFWWCKPQAWNGWVKCLFVPGRGA